MSGIFNGRPLGDVAGQIFDYNGELLTVKYATLSTSSSGATQVVAAVTGKRIHVVSGSLSAGGTTNVTLTSGSSGMALTGALSLVANANTPIGEIRTNPGEALFVTNSAAVAIVVNVAYVESSVGWESAFSPERYGSAILHVDFNQTQCRNAGAGGSTVLTADPETVLDRAVSTYRWSYVTFGSPVTYDQGAYGWGLNTNAINLNDTSRPIEGLQADGMRSILNGLTGCTFVFCGRIRAGVSRSSAMLISVRNNNAANQGRLVIWVNNAGAISAGTRRADSDSSTVNNSANGFVTDGSPFVLIASLNYTSNAMSVWVNGSLAINAGTISSSGGGAVSSTDSNQNPALMGPASGATGGAQTYPGWMYTCTLLNSAVTSAQAASITNHIRYLRGF